MEGRAPFWGLLPWDKNHYFLGMTSEFKKSTVQSASSTKSEAPLAGDTGDMRPVHEVFKGLAAARQPEDGGPEGQEPTTFGDWQSKGRCIDF
ncbi:MAG: DUF1674 domain-containing protein [Alphaproteobacteria bacterium]